MKIVYIKVVYMGFFLIPLLFSNEIYYNFQQPVETAEPNPCRPDVERAHHILETFITHPSWADLRSETGTEGLSKAQIRVLTDPQDFDKCDALHQVHGENLAMTSGPDNDLVYDYVYYQAGDFYFVVIVLAPPSNPDIISVGLSFIIVHDDNLNELAGYSF